MSLHAVLQHTALIREWLLRCEIPTRLQDLVLFSSHYETFQPSLIFHNVLCKSILCASVTMIHGKEKWAFSRTSWLESSWFKTAFGSTATYVSISVFRQRSYTKVSRSICKGRWVSPEMQPTSKVALVSTEGYCNEREMESFAEQTRAIKAKFTCACQFEMSKQLPSSNGPKEAKQGNVPV